MGFAHVAFLLVFLAGFEQVSAILNRIIDPIVQTNSKSSFPGRRNSVVHADGQFLEKYPILEEYELEREYLDSDKKSTLSDSRIKSASDYLKEQKVQYNH
jgi:hypothetical protein